MIRTIAFFLSLLFVGILFIPPFTSNNPTPVRVVVLKPTLIESKIRVMGRVESARVVNLSALLQGVVKAVNVKKGDVVDAGSLLMLLDDKQAQVRVKIMEGLDNFSI